MSEHTTLTSYLEALVGDKEILETVDVEALVEERLSDMKARVKAEIVAEIEHDKVVVEAKIEAVKNAITIVANANAQAEEDEDDVSEVVSDETY